MAEEKQIGIQVQVHVRDATRELNQLERELRQLDGTATEAAKSAQATAAGVTRGGRAAARAEHGWNRAAESIKDFVIAGGLANTAAAALLRVGSAVGRLPGAIVEAGIAAEGLEKRFRFAFDGAAEGARQLDFVRSEAQRLGIDFAAAAQSYAGLAAATRGTALEGAATREAFTAVAEAARVMGLSTSEARGALTALERIASKGTVSAEELRGQLGERLPGAFQIAARAMGVSTAELERMLAAGELLAVDFLPRFAEQIRAEMAGSVPEAVDTAAASFARLRNAMRDIGEAIAESGVVDFVADVAEAGARAFSTPTAAARIVDLARDVAADRAAPPRAQRGTQAFTANVAARRLEVDLAAELDQGGIDAALDAYATLSAEMQRVRAKIATAEAQRYRRGMGGYHEVSVEDIVAPLQEQMAEVERARAVLSGHLRRDLREDGAAGPAPALGVLYARRLRADNAGADRVSAASYDADLRARTAAAQADAEADEAAARLREQATERLETIERASIERTQRFRLNGLELLQWQEEQALAAIAAEEHASIAAREAAAEAIRDEYRARREELERQSAERRAAREEAEAQEEERRRERRDAERLARAAAQEAAQQALERADPFAGAEAALERLGSAAEDAGDRVGRAIETGFRSAEDALVRFATAGRLEFASLTDSILADLARIAVRRAITQPLAAALGSALGSLDFSGGGGVAVPAAAEAGNVFHAVYHAGGAAGAPGGVGRIVPPAVFAGAPRLHRGGVAGLRADEVPAILQRGETVLPRGAPAAAPTEVRVEVTNRGTPQQVTQADGRFDGQRLVVSLVAEDIAGGGPVAGAIGRAFAIAPRTG